MKYQIKVSLFSFAVLFFPHAFAAPIAVDCSLSYVFCMEELLAAAEPSKSMEEIIEKLPTHVKRNFTLKRGNNIEKTINGMKVIVGPHGHLAPTNQSASATPEQPRVFVWDEKSGFTASWNSGNPDHSAGDRMDLYHFDFATNEHRLTSWTAADGIADHTLVDKNGRSCVTCHGEVQRPIFPMYPDWPQFYGEFNDEMSGYGPNANALRKDLKILANEFQPKERALYFDFLKNEAVDNPRYSLVYDVMQDESNPYYPFRPRTTTSPFSDVSRAFYFRPNLRLGVLYNRLTALQVFEKIKASPVFKKFPDVMFYALLDCNWNFNSKTGQSERTEILDKLLDGAESIDPRFADITLRGAQFSASDIAGFPKSSFVEDTVGGKKVYYSRGRTPYTAAGYQQVPYEDVLKLLDLKIADMDIRFRHDSTIEMGGKFNVYDPKAFYFTDSAMDIGYIKDTYKLNPICDNAGTKCNFSYDSTYMQGTTYFNSYFDGSATMNELLVAQILLYLTDVNQDFSGEPALAAVRTELRKSIPDPKIYFETLMKKYSHFEDRLKLDKVFFTRMDILGPWIQLPYPKDLLNVHNRESFWSSGASEIRAQHAQWSSLADRNSDKANRNGGKNICWNVYDTMKARGLTK